MLQLRLSVRCLLCVLGTRRILTLSLLLGVFCFHRTVASMQITKSRRPSTHTMLRHPLRMHLSWRHTTTHTVRAWITFVSTYLHLVRSKRILWHTGLVWRRIAAAVRRSDRVGVTGVRTTRATTRVNMTHYTT